MIERISPDAEAPRDGGAILEHLAEQRPAGLPVARLEDLVGALARPVTAGAGAVPGGVQLVGNLRP